MTTSKLFPRGLPGLVRDILRRNLGVQDPAPLVSDFERLSYTLGLEWDTPGRALLAVAHSDHGKRYEWEHRLTRNDAHCVGALLGFKYREERRHVA